MQFYIIHPYQKVLDKTGIEINDHIMTLEMNLAKVNRGSLASGKYAVVAPGNSFGLMDGGYDQALVDFFGEGLQAKIQGRIAYEYYGELPVGCAVSTQATDDQYPVVVYAPTMQVPMSIVGSANVYYATLAAIREAQKYGCENVLLPLMGAGAGCMALPDVGRQMMAAIEASQNTPNAITWTYAIEKHKAWHKLTNTPE